MQFRITITGLQNVTARAGSLDLCMLLDSQRIQLIGQTFVITCEFRNHRLLEFPIPSLFKDGRRIRRVKMRSNF